MINDIQFGTLEWMIICLMLLLVYGIIIFVLLATVFCAYYSQQYRLAIILMLAIICGVPYSDSIMTFAKNLFEEAQYQQEQLQLLMQLEVPLGGVLIVAVVLLCLAVMAKAYSKAVRAMTDQYDPQPLDQAYAKTEDQLLAYRSYVRNRMQPYFSNWDQRN